MKLAMLFVCTLSLAAVTGCGGSGDATDEAAAPSEEELVAKKAIGNWDCAAEEESNAAIEELSISTTLKGVAKAFLDVSGPGDFIETYRYKATASQANSGNIVIKGTSFELTIEPHADPKTKEHAATLVATGPKSAELYANQKIKAKMSCAKQ